jgi:hypothetical protein
MIPHRFSDRISRKALFIQEQLVFPEIYVTVQNEPPEYFSFRRYGATAKPQQILSSDLLRPVWSLFSKRFML